MSNNIIERASEEVIETILKRVIPFRNRWDEVDYIIPPSLGVKVQAIIQGVVNGEVKDFLTKFSNELEKGI